MKAPSHQRLLRALAAIKAAKTDPVERGVSALGDVALIDWSR
jgi:hypothetical protein